MATMTKISWAVLPKELEPERKKYGWSYSVLVSSSLCVLLWCLLRTSRNNCRNIRGWWRWQTCNSIIGIIQSNRWYCFSFCWLSTPIIIKRSSSIFTFDAPLHIPSAYQWVPQWQCATSIHADSFPTQAPLSFWFSSWGLSPFRCGEEEMEESICSVHMQDGLWLNALKGNLHWGAGVSGRIFYFLVLLS